MRYPNTTSNRGALVALSNVLETIGVRRRSPQTPLTDINGRFTKAIHLCSTCVGTGTLAGLSLAFDRPPTLDTKGQPCDHCAVPIYE